MTSSGATSSEGVVEQQTICRCCSVGCGIILELDGNQVVGVQGDPDHPLSRGYTCAKGRALPQFHHHADRLLEPLSHGRPVDWGFALDEIASECQEVIERYGSGSIGHYTSTGHTSDTNGWPAGYRFFRLLGCTSQHYTGATVDIAPAWRAAELVIGSARELHPEWIPEEDGPRLLLMIGMNPVVSHGYLVPVTDPVRRIRDYRRARGQVWVLDPRQTQTARLADHHIALRPGSDALILAWLVKELLASGADQDELARYTDPGDIERLRQALSPFDLSVVAAAAGVEHELLTTLLQSIRAVGKIAAIAATGVTFNEHALVAEWLRWVLLIITGSLDWPGGMPFDAGWLSPLEERSKWPLTDLTPGPASRPELARYFGEVPCVAMVDEIESGALRALFITGANPLTAFPDPDRTAAALASLDLLVVLDVVGSDLTELATHVLPCAGQLERTDMTSWRMMYIPAVVPARGNAKQSWWIYAQLGQRLGVDVLGGLDPDTCTDEMLIRRKAARSRDGADALIAAGPHGIKKPVLYGWVHERVLPSLPNGCWRVAPEVLLGRLPDLLQGPDPDRIVLVSRREVNKVNSARYAVERRPGHDALLMHPKDARGAGLTEGDRVRVTSDSGSIETVVKLDERYREGVVSLNHGHMAPNVNRLVSPKVDLQTGQPVMTGIAVTVTLAEAALAST